MIEIIAKIVFTTILLYYVVNQALHFHILIHISSFLYSLVLLCLITLKLDLIYQIGDFYLLAILTIIALYFRFLNRKTKSLYLFLSPNQSVVNQVTSLLVEEHQDIHQFQFFSKLHVKYVTIDHRAIIKKIDKIKVKPMIDFSYRHYFTWVILLIVFVILWRF